MRDIKFRAWNTMSGHMWPLQRMNFINGQLLYVGSNMPTPKEYKDKYIVMQYTGLKDKNGKEIYESDILKDEFGRVDLVYWVEDGARFTMRQKNKKTGYFVVVNHLSEEVIGNIYENPELWEISK